jgi:hypothetical protein
MVYRTPQLSKGSSKFFRTLQDRGRKHNMFTLNQNINRSRGEEGEGQGFVGLIFICPNFPKLPQRLNPAREYYCILYRLNVQWYL